MPQVINNGSHDSTRLQGSHVEGAEIGKAYTSEPAYVVKKQKRWDQHAFASLCCCLACCILIVIIVVVANQPSYSDPSLYCASCYHHCYAKYNGTYSGCTSDNLHMCKPKEFGGGGTCEMEYGSNSVYSTPCFCSTGYSGPACGFGPGDCALSEENLIDVCAASTLKPVINTYKSLILTAAKLAAATERTTEWRHNISAAGHCSNGTLHRHSNCDGFVGSMANCNDDTR